MIYFENKTVDKINIVLYNINSMKPQNQIIDAEVDSAKRVEKGRMGTPLPPKKEPKVKTSRNGIILVQ